MSSLISSRSCSIWSMSRSLLLKALASCLLVACIAFTWLVMACMLSWVNCTCSKLNCWLNSWSRRASSIFFFLSIGRARFFAASLAGPGRALLIAALCFNNSTSIFLICSSTTPQLFSIAEVVSPMVGAGCASFLAPKMRRMASGLPEVVRCLKTLRGHAATDANTPLAETRRGAHDARSDYCGEHNYEATFHRHKRRCGR
mmetsp:Transcript_28348/g.54012  ORF Transcript_28348/g.54012 Transcript_28348/m.54012 type:complete len:201 (-) Transcript_28348:54-656(-)